MLEIFGALLIGILAGLFLLFASFLNKEKEEYWKVGVFSLVIFVLTYIFNRTNFQGFLIALISLLLIRIEKSWKESLKLWGWYIGVWIVFFAFMSIILLFV